MDLMDKGSPANGSNRRFAELNRRRSDELRAEARDATGDVLRSTMADALWHSQEARRLEAAADLNLNWKESA